MYFIHFYQYQIQIHDKLQRPLQGSGIKVQAGLEPVYDKTPENLDPFSSGYEWESVLIMCSFLY